MRGLDLSSTIVAAIIGGALLWAAVYAFGSVFNAPDDTESGPNWGLIFAAGAVIGAGVQTGVRLTGVS